MSTDTDTSQKRILHWTLAIAAILLFFSTLATVGVVWWMRKSSVTEANTAGATAPNSAMANWSRATFTSGAADGVHQTSAKSWSVKGGRAFVNVRRKDDESLELRFVYPFDGDLLPSETITLVRTRWGANEVAKWAGELNITPEQMASLKAVSPATDIPVSAPDKERMRSLFEDYLATQDAATEKALVEAVTEIDQNYYERTRERIDGIAEKVKAIFDPDQLAALSERFGSRNR
ncbi:MAG TPA: hypothetical protein VNT99_11430 [Methylomirabilota bacterium]|nr:hypothetical protein [Methylomirabilota bacterium]